MDMIVVVGMEGLWIGRIVLVVGQAVVAELG